jgi:hypothetical protein
LHSNNQILVGTPYDTIFDHLLLVPIMLIFLF